MKYLFLILTACSLISCAGIVTFYLNRIITKGNIKTAEKLADGTMRVETHPPLPIPNTIVKE